MVVQLPQTSPNDLRHAFVSLGIALGLGLLVGLQRQRAQSAVAGVRSFGLATLLGAVAAQLTEAFGVWLLVVTILGVAVLVVARSVTARTLDGEDATGLATEIALLLMVCVGALVVHGPREVAVALGGCVMVLLQAKIRLHALAQGLSDKDFGAMVRFALISLVVLPVLPDQAYGPYAVLNPRHIWLMVVLVVGINLGAYVLRKLLGARAGMVVSGVLGGLVSSTATTASASRQARTSSPGAPALVVGIASAVLLPRVASVLAVTAPQALAHLWQPFLLLLATLGLSLALTWRWLQREPVDLGESTNPAELRGAVAFAAMFAAVLLAAAWARDELGMGGVFLVAAVSGLTDVDAITLSTARMLQESRLDARTGSIAIVIAIVANTALKLGVAGIAGGPRFLLRTLLLLGPMLLAGALWVVWSMR
ncbi:MAG: DUF4010 domain-containing protein [Planctomycetota bacterium]